MGSRKSRPDLREVHSNTGLPQEIRKISNKQPDLPPKRITKRTFKSQQKEGNNKDQISKMENRKTIENLFF